jgi:hypothetical protein
MAPIAFQPATLFFQRHGPNLSIAGGDPLDSLVQAIATRETEPNGIANRLLSTSTTSIDGRLR